MTIIPNSTGANIQTYSGITIDIKILAWISSLFLYLFSFSQGKCSNGQQHFCPRYSSWNGTKRKSKGGTFTKVRKEREKIGIEKS